MSTWAARVGSVLTVMSGSVPSIGDTSMVTPGCRRLRIESAAISASSDMRTMRFFSTTFDVSSCTVSMTSFTSVSTSSALRLIIFEKRSMAVRRLSSTESTISCE